MIVVITESVKTVCFRKAKPRFSLLYTLGNGIDLVIRAFSLLLSSSFEREGGFASQYLGQVVSGL